MIAHFDQVFIFFDALDEYDDGPGGFSNDFKNLLDLSNTNLFVTSRPSSTSRDILRQFEVLEVRTEDSKIEYYVRQRLSDSWIADESEIHYKTLQAAVGIRIDGDDLNSYDSTVIRAVEQIVYSNKLMINTDPSLQTLAFSHYSFKEDFQQLLPTLISLLPGPDNPDTFIAKKCLTFLRWNTFSRHLPTEPGELEDRLARHPILSYAARYWGEHAFRGTSQQLMEDIKALFGSSHNTMSTGLAMSIYEHHPSHYERAYQGMCGLHISAYFGLTEVVAQILTESSIHPDVTTTGGWTALHWAARRGLTPMVSTLLSYCASPSEITKLDGWTALHLAAKEGHVDVVLELMKAGVDVDAKDVNLRTPLYLATWGGHTDVVHHLLQASADSSIANLYGATALHCAVKRGRELIVEQLLLSKDININAVDKSGVTALDEAIRKQNKAIICMLTEVRAETRWNTNMLPADSIVNDLNWEAYTVNGERTAKVQKGMQCTCHVLEKASGSYSSTSPPMIFRKTFSLSADAEGLVKKYFESERMILHRLRHPNVVAYLDFDEDPDQNSVLLYMEYCDLGDLETCHGRRLSTASDSGQEGDDDSDDGDDYGFYTEDASSSEKTTALDSQSTWSLIAQLSMALAYLHYGLTVNFRDGSWEASFESSWHNVLHRDIKPANVVVQGSESDSRIFKLCDLGIAAEAGKGSGHNTTQYIGSQAFRPPEVSSGRRWSTKGDMWSFGATVRELKKLKDTTLRASIKKMIDKCTARKPNNRPSSLEMLEEARALLEANQLMDYLPLSSRLQIQTIHNLLGGRDGGYLMQAFNLVAELLDDIVPFHNKLAKDRRKETIERLYVLWNDGVERCFQDHLNEFSLHILVLLPLTPNVRAKHIPNVIKSASLNNRWQRSRWTPLHLAVQEGNEEMIKDLLRNGADRRKEDIHGCTPGFYSKGLPSIAALLQ
ncbi:hypothetical protein FPOAC1_007060 [Fusarium poae]|uniref:hypothetical protein n=1 Tax=Fusarium poae TaxID=36050 RepID=UPI001CE9D9B5|nr:hypothetical protein FPOAC1_007060 [Fusarium poae]KAG8673742.1 hypothetical protein FPOAC1_007060 [Fusarium poae]